MQYVDVHHRTATKVVWAEPAESDELRRAAANGTVLNCCRGIDCGVTVELPTAAARADASATLQTNCRYLQ